MKKHYVTVFCGSSAGYHPSYADMANHFAELLIQHGCALVYGGAKVGLMGILADKMLELGGEVIGVIPDFMIEKELAHDGLTKLHIVKSMHERKIMMMELADSFVLLPGGAGSLDEFFEVMTFSQLGICDKPFGILNTNNYYHHQLQFLHHAVSQGFIKSHDLDKIIITEDGKYLLQCLHSSSVIVSSTSIVAC